MMGKVYKIKDWDKHFEVAQSRRSKTNTWVAVPIKHDGKSYKRLMREKDGVTLFGIWILIIEIAAKCPERGVLADEDGPLTAEDMAIKTDAPQELFERALEVLVSKRIGWMVGEQSERAPATDKQTNKQTDTGSPIDWLLVSADAEKISKTVPINSEEDRSLILQACVLSQDTFSRDWLFDAVEAVNRHRKVKKKQGYFFSTLRSKAKELGRDFDKLRKRIRIPDGTLKKISISGNNGKRSSKT